MDVLRDKEGRYNIRHIILVFVVLSGIAAALILYPPIPTKTDPDKTSGDITFTDSGGNPLTGGIELSGAEVSSGLKPNVNFISWTNVPNARVYYNALGTKDVSVNLRIAGNSPKGKVILENYAVTIPGSVNTTPPGTLVKYVEVSATGVSFVEAEITIQYADAEVNGINESTLTLYRYDIAAEAWSELPATIDEKNNILGATVNSLSIFAVSTRIPGKIEVRDTMRAPVVSDIKTYDEAKNVKKAEKASLLSAADIPARGELEVDALKTKSVAVKLKVKTPGSGEIILEDYGRKNPVASAPPGNTIKYVDIGAVNIDFESAEVRIAYTNAELGGADENTLTIYHWNGAFWEALPTTIDAVNNILTATTTSLSPFAASAGEGGQARVLVATNRFVILDDPKVGKNETGFVQPSWGGYPLWTQWTGINTMINATALYMDKNGTPVKGTNITFTFYDPNGTVNTTKYSTTNSLGLANVSLQMNDFSFYGRWKVRAGNGTMNSSNTTFIYNWWGCAFGGGTCGYGGAHLSESSIPGGMPINSPYLSGRDQLTGATSVHSA
ncbi:MAG: hypothetical protein Q8N79_01450, partial [Candidatus Methanoperedens sp.]|nr:hypothetical protein [Candidatus Methanoperedens sp.]